MTTDERVSMDAIRQQLTYWRERARLKHPALAQQLVACLEELAASRERIRVASHALGAIAGGAIYPQKLAQEALDLIRLRSLQGESPPGTTSERMAEQPQGSLRESPAPLPSSQFAARLHIAAGAVSFSPSADVRSLLLEAADENERLRNALNTIATYGDEDDEWDAAERYAAVRNLAEEALSS